MPDPTNVEQIQEERAQMAQAAMKASAVRNVLYLLEPEATGHLLLGTLTYPALLTQLQRVIEAELASLHVSTPPAEKG